MAVTKYLISGEKRGRKPNTTEGDCEKKRGRKKSSDSENGVVMWQCQFYYTDYTGTKKKKHKKGFRTKREAEEWERKFLERKSSVLDNKTMNTLIDEYFKNPNIRLKESTKKTKEHILDIYVRPYLGNRIVSEITPSDIRDWRDNVSSMKYETSHGERNLSQSYLRTIDDCLSSLFVYARDIYHLFVSPMSKKGAMGSKQPIHEMQIWTVDEFNAFLDEVKNKEISYYVFLVLFWTGIRLGELLALNIGDLDLENRKITISKTLYRYHGQDIITSPKTENSEREISLPKFVADELNTYVAKLYGNGESEKLFDVTKSFIEKEIKRGAKGAGIKPIRVHDLRHSHASYLICEMEVPTIKVKNRLGHKSSHTTMDFYGHLYPEHDLDIANKIDAYYRERKNAI